MAKDLRRRIVEPAAEQGVRGTPDWLDLASLAEIEVSSEDPAHLFAHALLPRYEPSVLHRVYLHSVKTELTRTQELTLAWAQDRSVSAETPTGPSFCAGSRCGSRVRPVPVPTPPSWKQGTGTSSVTSGITMAIQF